MNCRGKLGKNPRQGGKSARTPEGRRDSFEGQEKIKHNLKGEGKMRRLANALKSVIRE